MTANTMKARIPRPPQRTMIVAGIGLPFLAPSVLGPWADALIPAAFGIAFLASLATPTPLLARFARRRAANDPERAARLTQPDVVRTLARLNVVWGVALLAEAALLLFLANRVSASQLGLVSTVLGFGVPALLGPATLAFIRHSRSAALATR
jgi:hypothetical protein